MCDILLFLGYFLIAILIGFSTVFYNIFLLKLTGKGMFTNCWGREDYFIVFMGSVIWPLTLSFLLIYKLIKFTMAKFDVWAEALVNVIKKNGEKE